MSTIRNSDKTVGILGGMGPEATVDLQQRIIQQTPAIDDYDHIRCIIDNNPKVPSRIKAIIDGNGEDPSPCLVKMAKGLENAGADFLVIPCNTAHYYYDAIQQAVNIPVVHIIKIGLAKIQQDFPLSKTVGILASPAIQMTKLYDELFNLAGLETVYPDIEQQELLFSIIKEVKSGSRSKECQQKYHSICEHLANKGIDIAIVACTELSILNNNSSIHTIDALDLLAQEIITLAKS